MRLAQGHNGVTPVRLEPLLLGLESSTLPHFQLETKIAILSANNKGADQPAHQRSVCSVFVIWSLKSIIAKLATCKVSFFEPICVTEQTS